MDKVLEFLEKHVQWVAVGLGGLFLAWVLYAYILMSPVEVAVPGQTAVHPGNVDDLVNKNFAKPLSDDMANTAPVDPPTASKQNPQQAFETLAKAPATPPADLPMIVMNAPRSDVKIDNEDRRNGGDVVLVEELPTVPSAPVVETIAKRAFVGPAVAVAGAAAPPPPPVAPGNAANPLPPGHDLSYVRVTYSVPVDLIAKAFDAVKVRQATPTGVIAVKLMRQEKLADGTWGPASEVALPKTGIAHRDLPPNNAAPAVYTDFRTWADSQQGQTDLLRPVFYPIVYGEGPWDPPMEDQMPVFDPEADRKARQQKYKEDQEKKRQATPPRQTTPRPARGNRPGGGAGGPGAGGGGAPNFAPAGQQRPADAGGVFGTQTAPPADGVMPTDPNAVPPTQQPVAPGAGLPPADAIAPPAFVPAQAQAFSAWAYDETVVEGHVYRYQVLYALRNPVFDSNITKPADLAKIFTLWSVVDDNAWGHDVEVKPTAEYYLNTTNWQNGSRIPPTITIDVYKWANGKWQTQAFKVAAGDEIGEEMAGVNYATGTTVVDLRFDPRTGGPGGRPYVLLLTPGGQLLEREPTADRNNPQMLRIKGAIAAGQNAVAGQPGIPAQLPPPGQPGANRLPVLPPTNEAP